METISSLTRIVSLFFTLVTITWIIKVWRQDRRLSAFKGPFSARFCHAWHAWSMIKVTWYTDYADLCAKYGTIARIGPNELITNSPDVVMQMNAVRKNYTKNRWWYRTAEMEPGVHNVFSQCDEKEHGRRREQVAAGYSQRNNTHLEQTLDIHITNLLTLLRTKYCSSGSSYQPIDFARKVQYFTTDTITDLCYSKPLGDLEADKDIHNHIESAAAGVRATNIALATGLTDFLNSAIVQKLFFARNEDQGLATMIRNIRHEILSRISSKPTPDNADDMISSWTKAGLTPTESLAEASLSLFAGSDNTASIIRSVILFLSSNPSCYLTLQREIDASLSAADGIPGIVTHATASNLPYLQAVIKESMRILPPGLDPAPKITPPEGDTFTIDNRNVFVPGGTSICVSIWGILRRPEIFGEDTAVFRPERWIENQEEKVRKMERTLDLVFGSGRWSCLGMGVAKMQVGKCVFELLRHFAFGVVNPERPWKSENYLALWQQSEFWLRITARSGSGG